MSYFVLIKRMADGFKIFSKIFIIFSVFSLANVTGFYVAFAAAGVPKVIGLQGSLLDSNGNLLGGSAGVNYCFKFSLANDITVGAPDVTLWPTATPSTMTVNVKEGVFNAYIGDVSAGGDYLDYDFKDSDSVFVNIEVAPSISGSCSGVTSFENLAPRQRVTSSAFSLVSGSVNGDDQSSIGSTTPIENVSLSVFSTSTNSVALALKAVASQVADLFQIFDSLGNKLFFVDNNGGVFASSTLQVGGSAKFYSDLGAGSTTVNSLSVTNTSTSTFAGGLSVGGAISAESLQVNNINFSSSTAQDLTVSNSLKISNLNGLLFANNGAVSQIATSSLGLSSSDVSEGNNLYYTQGRFDTAFSGKSTTNLSEGSNLYYTDSRFDTRFGTKSTSNLVEGSNLYFTNARVDARFATKSTSDLAEGVNLYYTNNRVNDFLSASSTIAKTYGSNIFGGLQTFSDIFATSTSIVNGTTTNSTSTNLFATNGNITNATTTNATSTNLFANIINGLTSFIANLTSNNINTTNITATGTATINNLFAANSTTTNSTSTNSLFANNLFSSNGTFGTFSATNTSGTSTIASGQGFTVGGSKFVVDGFTGNIGVGTTTPNSIFQIANTGTRQILITDNDAALDAKHWYIESNAGALNIGELNDALSVAASNFQIQGDGDLAFVNGQEIQFNVNNDVTFADNTRSIKFDFDSSASAVDLITASALNLYSSASAVSLSSLAGNTFIASSANLSSVSISAGDNLPSANANGNDVDIRAEDDIIIDSADIVLQNTGVLSINGTNGTNADCTGGLNTPQTLTTVDGIVTVHTCGTSDIRLKQNVQTYENVLERLAKVRAVTFEWNDKYYEVSGSPKEIQDPTHYGFVAQEMQKEFPEIISHPFEGTDYLGIGDKALPSIIWQGLRELNQKVERYATSSAGLIEVNDKIEDLSVRFSAFENTGTTNGLVISSINTKNNEILSMLSDVEFFGTPYFTKDTAGFAKIKTGAKSVDVVFSKEYMYQPIVNATVSLNSNEVESTGIVESQILNGDIRYLVTKKNEKGFTVMLNKPAPTDINFSWTAFVVKDARTFVSRSPEEIITVTESTSQTSETAPTEPETTATTTPDTSSTTTPETGDNTSTTTETTASEPITAPEPALDTPVENTEAAAPESSPEPVTPPAEPQPEPIATEPAPESEPIPAENV
jgi:hypothetical protein